MKLDAHQPNMRRTTNMIKVCSAPIITLFLISSLLRSMPDRSGLYLKQLAVIQSPYAHAMPIGGNPRGTTNHPQSVINTNELGTDNNMVRNIEIKKLAMATTNLRQDRHIFVETLTRGVICAMRTRRSSTAILV